MVSMIAVLLTAVWLQEKSNTCAENLCSYSPTKNYSLWISIKKKNHSERVTLTVFLLGWSKRKKKVLRGSWK